MRNDKVLAWPDYDPVHDAFYMNRLWAGMPAALKQKLYTLWHLKAHLFCCSTCRKHKILMASLTLIPYKVSVEELSRYLRKKTVKKFRIQILSPKKHRAVGLVVEWWESDVLAHHVAFGFLLNGKFIKPHVFTGISWW